MTEINRFKYYLLLFIILGLLIPSHAQKGFPGEKDIRKMIRKEQNSDFLALLKDGLPDHYQAAKRPLLYYALRFNNNTVLKYLLDFGADPDTWYKDKNMLMWGVRFNRHTAVQLLLEYGAEVDASNSHGVTALMMAAWMDHASIMKLLIRHGADIYRKDEAGNTSVKLAVYKYEENTGFEMDTRIFMRQQVDARHDYVDGPYVTYLNDSLAKVLYTYYDVSDSSVKRVDSLFKTRNGSFSFRGFVFDTLKYRVELPVVPQQDVFRNVEKVFAINDVHGYYDKFVRSLRENGVVDNEQSWNFGKGHLVINGDVFDRGEGVTRNPLADLQPGKTGTGCRRIRAFTARKS
ncbi:MAG: ankyrin repeat domain-containing protein [Bacteroidota bacterium]|nr:ankyrin repeat domain-containing protein [Bacteroidota bacterium]